MQPTVQLLPGAVAEILASASESGRIDLSDRYGLMAAVLDESLDEEQMRAINRLLRAVAKGRIRVLDQLVS
ncbi:MAG: hypothetical protein HC910_13920 [Spirulinaceae cyanobacterium SM2_1_0]|nr:hypothetical protein [Spirulinaceae cyanobacterium SM2_1_0]